MNGGMHKMMKQLQKVQSQMAKIQEELGERTLQSSSGGGAVKVEVNGKKEIISVEIAPEVMQDEDRDMVGDLIVAAVNDALQKVDEMVSTEMQKVTGGLPPGLFQ